MKVMTIEMPYVAKCTVSECAFNVSDACHAKAITVGNGLHAGCDTFLGAPGHTRAKERTAGIGACKSTSCKHNEDFECVTDHIMVARAGAEVNCVTFVRR